MTTLSDLPLIQDCVLVVTGGETVGFEINGGAILAGNLTDAPTSILVDASSTAYVLADEGNTYDTSSGGSVEPLASDRAAWDALGFAARHANDIDLVGGVHHSFAALDRRYIKPGSLLIPPPRLDIFSAAQQVVNSNVGTFGDSTHAVQLTLDRFGRVTMARNIPIVSRQAMSMSQPAGASGVTRSGTTADGHLAVWNGASADSIRDGGAVPAGGGGDFLVMQVFS